MKSLLMILTTSLLAIGLTSCSDRSEESIGDRIEGEPDARVTEVESMSDRDIENDIEMERETVARDSETWTEERSRDVVKKIEELEAKLDDFEAKAKMKSAWSELQELSNDIDEKITELNSEAEPKWKEFKADVDARLEKIKKETREFLYSE